MTKLSSPFDIVVYDLLQRCEADPEAAAELLRHAASYIRSGTRMPAKFAEYLADAFESAACASPGQRAKQLTYELNLTATNRRKAAVHWLDAVAIIRSNPGASERKLIKLLAAKHGCGATTARNRIKQAAANMQEAGH